MRLQLLLVVVVLAGCLSPEAGGIALAPRARTTVKVDLHHKPLPLMPLPNDLATRHDPSSATGRRLNISLVSPSRLETHLRRLANQVDGWGVYQPIEIPFSGPLDVRSILKRHRDPVDTSDDVVYLINVDPRSPGYGRLQHLDVGNGNVPVVAETLDTYGKNDPRGWTLSLLFEEADEDLDRDGVLAPGEDTDADGVLDRPNYLPGRSPERADLAGRADALMTFYERETNTLILRPLLPLDERTTYAVVVTRRLRDAWGGAVGSPYPWINHTSQTADLRHLEEVLPRNLALEDVAFAFTFTTQSVQASMRAVRDGLYGHGVQAQLGATFPARLAGLERLRSAKHFPQMKNAYILQPERMLDLFQVVAKMALDNQFGNTTDSTIAQVREDQRFVDFHVIGSFVAPQLLRTRDAAGEPLDLHYRSWPEDLDRVPATAEGEKVYFWLTVPRKEVSARGQGKPVPVVIQGHGYNSTRAEGVIWGSYLSRYGVANIGIDFPSHGLGLSAFEKQAASMIAGKAGLLPLVDAVLKDRATDQDGDGQKDPGADFLTGYAFHTRDMMRQTVLDYMQLVRIVRSFDGKRRWAFDVNGDGTRELAGDFDGDGKLDIDGSQIIGVTGASLGGIVSLITGSLEPAIPTVASIAGGGGLVDLAVRSHQGGVPQAVMLRVMGPLFVGTLVPGTDSMRLQTIVPSGIEEQTLDLGVARGVRPRDTMVVENLRNGVRGCGLVDAKGRVHAAVQSDAGDRLEITFYRGPVVVGKGCQLKPGAKPRSTVDRFGGKVSFRGQSYQAGAPLVAVAEGLGRRRASPQLRRLMGLTQLIIDPGDPIAYVRHLRTEPLRYATGETTSGRSALITASVGDMAVNVSASVAAARAAGIVDFLRPDGRYGKSVNQLLIDTHTIEGVHTLERYKDAAGNGVHLDIDNLSRGRDLFGDDVPRLAPPLRLSRRDPAGGRSALLFPYSEPEGIHVFALPGMMTDQTRERCKKQCTTTTGSDPCGCDALVPFDIGVYMANVIARYLSTRGRVLNLDSCNSSNTCPDKQPPPKLRDAGELD
jgi:hypothetical protein